MTTSKFWESKQPVTMVAGAVLCLAGMLATPAGANPIDDLVRQATEGVRERIRTTPAPDGLPRPAASPPGKSSPPAQPGDSANDAAPGHLHPTKAFTTSADIVAVELPVFDGTPVIGYRQLPAPDGRFARAYRLGDANSLRWLLLMQIAARPEVLDNPIYARRVAVMFLPEPQWNEYLQCTSATNGNASRTCTDDLANMRRSARGRRDAITESYMYESLVQDWNGRNEFEKPRSHRAFVEKYRPILRAQAAKLPQDVLLFSETSLHEPYRNGMLPMADRAGNLYATFAMGGSIPIIGAYCALTAVQWPRGLTVPPTEAEALVNRLDDRKAYLALRLRLTRVDAGGNFGVIDSNPAYSNCRTEAQVLRLTMYRDAALREKLRELPVDGPRVGASRGF